MVTSITEVQLLVAKEVQEQILATRMVAMDIILAHKEQLLLIVLMALILLLIVAAALLIITLGIGLTTIRRPTIAAEQLQVHRGVVHLAVAQVVAVVAEDLAQAAHVVHVKNIQNFNINNKPHREVLCEAF